MAIINQAAGGGAPSGAAGGDLGATYPNPTVTGGTHLTAASVAIASLADPTTGKVIGSASNAAAAVFPPGYELGYTQITAPVNIASTTEATGTTIITMSAITFDGAPVLFEFFSPQVTVETIASDLLVVSLFESTTQIGRLAVINSLSATTNPLLPCRATYRFTPSAAAHTYTVTAFAQATTGTPSIGAGAGGTGALVPAFGRFTKV